MRALASRAVLTALRHPAAWLDRQSRLRAAVLSTLRRLGLGDVARRVWVRLNGGAPSRHRPRRRASHLPPRAGRIYLALRGAITNRTRGRA